MEETQVAEVVKRPAPQSCWLVEFEKARILTRPMFPRQYVLVVSGTKHVSMSIELVPRIYVRQPDYWGIEVVGRMPGGFVSPAFGPYTVSLSLGGVTGTEGVEVIGSNRTERLEVPPRPKPLGSFDLSITSKAGQSLATATLTCSPDGGSHPNPLAASLQLHEVDGHIGKIPAKEGICTADFNPVILRAQGTWNGEERTYEQEFSNRCVGVLATGGVVFDFDKPVVKPE